MALRLVFFLNTITTEAISGLLFTVLVVIIYLMDWYHNPFTRTRSHRLTTKALILTAALSVYSFSSLHALAQEKYTVQPGDSLSKIAREHNVTVEQLRQWNSLSGNLIFPGNDLIVSGGAALDSGAAAPAEETPAAPPVNIPEGVFGDPTIQQLALNPALAEYVYVVQENDSLNLLARRFATQVSTIRWVNDMDTDTIFIGKKMLIPTAGTPRAGFGEKVTTQGALPEVEARYSVRPGDSLFTLAQEKKTTVLRLRWRNNLQSSALKTGQVLIIPGLAEDDVTEAPDPATPPPAVESPPVSTDAPDVAANNQAGTETATEPPATGPPARPMPSQMTAEFEEEMARSADLHEYPHRVAPAETLEAIAKKWNSSVAAIMYLNDLTNQDLEVNRLLLVPSFQNLSSANKVGLANKDELTGTLAEAKAAGTEIKVGVDESLSGLALRAQTTVTRLRWLNGLNDNEIEVGDSIILP